MSDEHDWFAPKRYGYGAGLPLRWQGWVVLAAYFVVIGLAALLIPYALAAFLSIVAIATAALLMVAARKTRGGLRWRWGDME